MQSRTNLDGERLGYVKNTLLELFQSCDWLIQKTPCDWEQHFSDDISDISSSKVKLCQIHVLRFVSS